MAALRQLKKDRTRATLIGVSARLFAAQGYDATTLEQIAAEAEVSVPTLLVYFESKERLALASKYDELASFQAQVEDLGRTEDTLAIWRRHVLAGASAAGSKPREYVRFNKFLASSPSLVRGLLVLLQKYEEVLAAGLARDYGAGLETSLMATTLAFGNHTAVRRWVASGGKGALADACADVIDFVANRRRATRAAAASRRP